ncbi:B12-binding domain-containing radical SAM protein [Tsukamurella pulmonis]|nr:cobalamin-dependent protein [Tsukamurella pulmonis]
MQQEAHMLVIVVSPPNSNTVLDGAECTVTKPEEHTDWSDFPNLGVLTLASCVAGIRGVRPVYLDGTVVNWAEIAEFVDAHASETLAICISALTATYEAGLHLVARAKRANPRIVSIFGNDHITALPVETMTRQSDLIDVAFVGNEVIGGFAKFVHDLSSDNVGDLAQYPGMIYRSGGSVCMNNQVTEGVFTDIDYELIDADFNHTALYRDNFARRVVPTFQNLTGRTVRAGIPVEIARGCIKFARNDACSFCSIQYGGMWRNSAETPDLAWDAIAHAEVHGFDYLYLTADELPLTFGRLLGEMRDNPPDWWRSRAEEERPVMVGYARSDGLSNERNAETLRYLNIRQLMVGLDAGTSVSLRAMRKPLAPGSDRFSEYRAEAMFEHNIAALSAAKNNDLVLKVGFVIGHLGMTPSLLRENLDSMKSLLDSGAGAIASLDVEVLSLEPGSMDYRQLIDPDVADAAAANLDLMLPDRRRRVEIAKKWAGRDILDREAAMSDYVEAVMPQLSMADLVAARREVRAYAHQIGVTTGG